MLPRPRTSRVLPWKLPSSVWGLHLKPLSCLRPTLLQDPMLCICSSSPNLLPSVSTWKSSCVLYYGSGADLSFPPTSLPLHPIPILFLFVLQILFYFDIVFTTIFTIEIALKVKP